MMKDPVFPEGWGQVVSGQPMPTNEGSADIVERLRRKVHRGQYTMGGASCTTDGNAISWGGEKIMEYANPDGAEAADAIEARDAEITRLTAEITRLQTWPIANLTACSDRPGDDQLSADPTPTSPTA